MSRTPAAVPSPVDGAALLGLAATPTFALMALLTWLGGDASAMICSIAPHAWPVGGMVPMYLLMSLFHSRPWLKLVSTRRSHPG
jgi:hypothetical protein